ncbi:Ubiquitin-related modifier 1 [Grifola frondosa]|uniref:Ubiquitin-related modifier 1 n=1 Tax=Grifola frondosa TaxID=5627 RepID=A0A1C7MIK9_GRIFR|nr:Ubiquitin-related modifier 1 [Grifola frondosa]
MSTISLKIELGGGLELLFSSQRSHRVTIPSRVPISESRAASGSPEDATADGETKPADLAYLIFWMRDNLLKERAELFVENGTVRPGVLVLVNDTDWELEGEGEYQLQDGDEIAHVISINFKENPFEEDQVYDAIAESNVEAPIEQTFLEIVGPAP